MLKVDRQARVTRQVNVGLGVLVAALGAALLWKTSSDLDFRSADATPGPGYFPTLITACLVILGLWLAVLWLLSPSARNGTAERLSLQWAHMRRVAAVWLVLVLTTVLIEPIGFLAAGEVMAILLIVFVDRVRSVPLIATLLLLPPAMYLLFVVLLDVDLPGGQLWT